MQTIIDYDKIVRAACLLIDSSWLTFDLQMVLDVGQLVEFGSPQELLSKEQGYFKALVDESDERETLYKLARGN